MKTCPECGATHAVQRLFCLQCSTVLDERTYLKLVYVTFAVAFAIHFMLGRAGYPGTGLISETFQTEVLLLILAVAAWKLIQKSREPQRRISYELASLYSDRTDRLVILGLLVFMAIYFLKLGIPFRLSQHTEPHVLTLFRKARFWVVVPGGLAYIAILLSIQRAAFFNFNVSNPMLAGEFERAEQDARQNSKIDS